MAGDAHITQLLVQASAGHPAATNQIFGIVYNELKSIAAQQMFKERQDQTLQATALVHEVWIKLIGNEPDISWNDRKHFFAAATQAMRRILVDAARARKRLRRGGDRIRMQLEEFDNAILQKDENLLALNEALDLFAERHPVKAELVCLRFFGGLTNSAAAKQLGISVSKADRDWVFAKAWLHEKIGLKKDG